MVHVLAAAGGRVAKVNGGAVLVLDIELGRANPPPAVAVRRAALDHDSLPVGFEPGQGSSMRPVRKHQARTASRAVRFHSQSVGGFHRSMSFEI